MSTGRRPLATFVPFGLSLVIAGALSCAARDDAFDRALPAALGQLAVVDSELFDVTRAAHAGFAAGRPDLAIGSTRSSHADLKRLVRELPQPHTKLAGRRVLTLTYLVSLANKKIDLLEDGAAAVRRWSSPADEPRRTHALRGIERREAVYDDAYRIALVSTAVMAEQAGDPSVKAYLERRYWSLPDSVAGIPLTRRFYATADSLERNDPGLKR